jgi:hypothetical protein
MEKNERKGKTGGNATSTRANEEHVKEFEGSSETTTTMKVAAVVNVV